MGGLLAAVAMATHHVGDGLEVCSVFSQIKPLLKTCTVTLIKEIHTGNVIRSLLVKSRIRQGIMMRNDCV